MSSGQQSPCIRRVAAKEIAMEAVCQDPIWFKGFPESIEASPNAEVGSYKTPILGRDWPGTEYSTWPGSIGHPNSGTTGGWVKSDGSTPAVDGPDETWPWTNCVVENHKSCASGNR